MTNKPMLSVERKVIEDILADAREPGDDYMAARKVLRALLDKPACNHKACKSLGEPHPFCNFAMQLDAQHQGEPVAVVMPDDWEDQLFDEMSRRFDLRKQIDDDHMVYDDTQIGVEFARDWIKARLNEVKP